MAGQPLGVAWHRDDDGETLASRGWQLTSHIAGAFDAGGRASSCGAIVVEPFWSRWA